MLPNNGKINEYSPVYQEFQNITLLDLIKMFNSRNDLNDLNYNQNNEIFQLLDIMAKHFGYHDRLDMRSQNQYGVNYANSLKAMNDMLNTLAQLYGYASQYDFVAQNKQRLQDEKLIASDINANQNLLRIDLSGNIWIKGQIENNPTKIGKAVVAIAQEYRENFNIKTAADYFNISLKDVKKEELSLDDLPF